MFVPQAGKTAFNQSTLILIISISFAVLCPRFETEETKNKHTAPGKENTHKFTPLCLAVLVGPTPPRPPHAKRSLTHPHSHHQVREEKPAVICTCIYKIYNINRSTNKKQIHVHLCILIMHCFTSSLPYEVLLVD